MGLLTGKFEQDLQESFRLLGNDSLDEVEDILTRVVTESPDDMRLMMGFNPPSERGNPPMRRTGDLADSLRGEMISKTAGEIEMMYYSQYLDENFPEEYLFRNFASEGVFERLETVLE